MKENQMQEEQKESQDISEEEMKEIEKWFDEPDMPLDYVYSQTIYII